MGVRIKLGRFLSVGKTGPRVHLPGRFLSGSVGSSGWRLFGRLGPFYGNWSGGRKK